MKSKKENIMERPFNVIVKVPQLIGYTHRSKTNQLGIMHMILLAETDDEAVAKVVERAIQLLEEDATIEYEVLIVDEISVEEAEHLYRVLSYAQP